MKPMQFYKIHFLVFLTAANFAGQNSEVESGSSLSKSVGKSPKSGKKMMVKELEKQANGRFVAQKSSQPELPAQSPRPKRAAAKKSSERLEVPGSPPQQPPKSPISQPAQVTHSQN